MARTSIKQREILFNDFFEIAPEGIVILDVNTQNIIKCNKNAEAILKYDSTELLSKGPANISPEFQPDGLRSVTKAEGLILSAFKGKKPVFEWLTLDGKGNLFWAEVRLVSLADLGKPWIYASFVDISERKEIERRLIEQNKKLNEIAFLQSHQVRQPIAHILGLLQLIQFDNYSDPLNFELLSRLKTTTQSFDTIISEVMKHTRQIETEHKLNYEQVAA